VLSRYFDRLIVSLGDQSEGKDSVLRDDDLGRRALNFDWSIAKSTRCKGLGKQLNEDLWHEYSSLSPSSSSIVASGQRTAFLRNLSLFVPTGEL
jgi:hypothetical protein